MRLTDFLSDIGRPVAYYPSLRHIAGSTPAGILLAQLIYWQGKGADPDGWVWKTAAEIEAETGLSTEEQITARKRLVRQGVMREKLKGIPAKVHFLLDLEKIDIIWQQYQQIKAMPKTCSGQHPKLDLGNAQNLIPAKSKTTTYITSETTPEITAAKAEPPAAALSAAPSPTPNQNQRREEGKAGEDKAVPLLSAEIEALVTTLLPPNKQDNARDTSIEELSRGADPAVISSGLKRYASELAKDPGKDGGWLRMAIREDWGRSIRKSEAAEQALQAEHSAAEAAAEAWWSELAESEQSQIESAFFCPSAAIRANPRQHRVWLHRRWMEEQIFASSPSQSQG